MGIRLRLVVLAVASAVALAVGGVRPAASAPGPSGSVVAWGDEYGYVPAGLTDVTAVAGGFYHSLALKADGTVVAWGGDSFGQSDVPDDLTGVTAISAGDSWSLALKSDGIVVAWGSDAYGQTDVPAGLTDVVAIDAGGAYHSLALRRDGTVVAWGWGDWASVPAGLTDVTAISAGNNHNLALEADGTVVAWGSDYWGQTDVPPGLSGVVAIAAGDSWSLALKSDGTVVGWGNDTYGQTDVPAGLKDVVAIAAGAYHSLALKADGTVVAWGSNYYGEGGVPAGLTDVTAIASGGHHNLALVVRDTTPPVITVPADMRVDATGPAGATVEFAASATDTDPSSPPVSCSPGSGTVFPIGTTAVTCTATDAAGNAARASFSIHIEGAAEQLDDLTAAVRGVGPGKSLADTVAAAQWFLAHGQPQLACLTLTAFQLEVRAQSGKKIPSAQAAALITDANRIKSVLGFPK